METTSPNNYTDVDYIIDSLENTTWAWAMIKHFDGINKVEHIVHLIKDDECHSRMRLHGLAEPICSNTEGFQLVENQHSGFLLYVQPDELPTEDPFDMCENCKNIYLKNKERLTLTSDR